MLTPRGPSRLSSVDAFYLGLAFGLRGHALLLCLFPNGEDARGLAAVLWSLFFVCNVMPVAYVWQCYAPEVSTTTTTRSAQTN